MKATLPDSAAGRMRLVAGDPCLDFVNTVGAREPAGPSPGTRILDDKLTGSSSIAAATAAASGAV